MFRLLFVAYAINPLINCFNAAYAWRNPISKAPSALIADALADLIARPKRVKVFVMPVLIGCALKLIEGRLMVDNCFSLGLIEVIYSPRL